MVFKRSGGFGGRDKGKPGFKKDFGGKPSFGGRGFEKRSFGDRPSFGGRGGGRSDGETFPATCSSCGKSFELPFRPSGDRPVYCRDCFGGKSDSNSRGFEKRDFKPKFERHDDKPRTDPVIEKMAREMEQISRKLDSLLGVINGASVKSKPVVIPEKPEITQEIKEEVSKSKEKAKKTIKKEEKTATKKKTVTKKKK